MARFRLAETRDDAQLTMLSREHMETPLGSLRFSRDPSFLQSLSRTYLSSLTVVCEDDGVLIGMGSRSCMRAQVFGQLVTIGYLNQLRSFERARSSTHLARAYIAMRSVVAHDDTAVCLSVILKENAHARAVLESGRAGMPPYRPITELTTFLFRERGMQRFAGATSEIAQCFSLSTADGEPCARSDGATRTLSIQNPTLRGRLSAAIVTRSIKPLWADTLSLHTAHLTNWSRSPSQPHRVHDSAFYAITLDERDARIQEARVHAVYATHAILYGVEWQVSDVLHRLIKSSSPVYIDSGKL